MRLAALLATAFLLASAVPSAAAESAVDPRLFAPYSPKAADRLDHRVFDDFLKGNVLDVGLSDRDASPPPTPPVGTRMTRGSTSNFRYESNRVMFHWFKEGTTHNLSVYRKSLVDAVNTVGLERFNRSEQLAIWFNLHNVLMLEEIAKIYPVQRLEKAKIKGSDALLREAKLVEIKGVPLSLTDIRAIVYANWKDPNVIYGFWDGVIGGPTLPRDAFTGANVGELLQKSAREFTTSRRGFERFGSTLTVSRLYDDARGYFPGWPDDVVTHLRARAVEPASAILKGKVTKIDASAYDWTVADLFSGDNGPPDPPNAQESQLKDQLGLRDDREYGGPMNASAADLLRKTFQKREKRGRVTVEEASKQGEPEKTPADAASEDAPSEPTVEELGETAPQK